AQQCGLAHAVRADQGDALAIGNLERDLVEQRPATGKPIADLDQVDEPHATGVRALTPTLPRERWRKILRRGCAVGSDTLAASASGRHVHEGAGCGRAANDSPD